jgi:hypothetical protein
MLFGVLIVTETQLLTRDELKRFAKSPVRCSRLRQKIVSLADFLAVLSDAIRTEDRFWFRGHEDVTFNLTPSALRFSAFSNRVKALGLMADFKRVADLKLPRPPALDKELEWAQLAQHYGLPTRLLDWTESATTALYFACLRDEQDGFVYMLNPIDLNRLSYPDKPRVLDPQQDSQTILAYLRTGARRTLGGRNPIAINPVWNSERLIMQKGVFTLHGKRFDLDGGAVPSLTAIPILRESKPRLRSELQRIGVDEMALFPELEHACVHLKRREGLENQK